MLKKLLISLCLLATLMATNWEYTQNDLLSKEVKGFVEKTLEKKDLSYVPLEDLDTSKAVAGGSYFEIYHNDSLLGYFAYNRAAACRPGGCASYDPSTNKDTYDPFYVGVIYNTEMKIQRVRILDYYSEYGLQITRKNWLKQFEQSNGCDIDEREAIDGVTGATISAKSLLDQLKGNCELLGSF
jgi:hypothetical protein